MIHKCHWCSWLSDSHRHWCSWMTHIVIDVDEWLISSLMFMNDSCYLQVSDTWMNEVLCAYQWVTSHIVRNLTRTNEFVWCNDWLTCQPSHTCVTRKAWVTRVRIRHVTQMNESRHTYERVKSNIRKRLPQILCRFRKESLEVWRWTDGAGT